MLKVDDAVGVTSYVDAAVRESRRFPLAPRPRRSSAAHAAIGALYALIGCVTILVGSGRASARGVVLAIAVALATAAYLARSVRANDRRVRLVVADGALGLEGPRSDPRHRYHDARLFSPRPIAAVRLRTDEEAPLLPSSTRRMRRLHHGWSIDLPHLRAVITDTSAPIVIVRFADGEDELWVTPADADAVIRAASPATSEEPADA